MTLIPPLSAAVAFSVEGIPIPQGSKTRGRYGLWDDNAKTLKPWRDQVKNAAIDISRYHTRWTGPVVVRLVYSFDRPQSHYRTGRNAHLLRAGVPSHPMGSKHGDDIDKLQRSILDAITDAKTIWRDDCQVVDVRARKFYAGEHELALEVPGVRIQVQEAS